MGQAGRDGECRKRTCCPGWGAVASTRQVGTVSHAGTGSRVRPPPGLLSLTCLQHYACECITLLQMHCCAETLLTWSKGLGDQNPFMRAFWNALKPSLEGIGSYLQLYNLLIEQPKCKRWQSNENINLAEFVLAACERFVAAPISLLRNHKKMYCY